MSRRKHLPACKDRASELGYSDLFERQNLLGRSLEYTEKVAEYYNEHGNYPPGATTLGKWLHHMRAAKAGKDYTRNTWYSECDDRVKELGFTGMFDFERTDIAISQTKEVIKFFKSEQRFPNSKGKTKNERTIGRWLEQARLAKAGKNKCTFYPEVERLAEKAGIGGMFVQPKSTFEDKALERTQQIIDLLKDEGRLPSHHCDDKEELALAQWLNHMRRIKCGKQQKGTFYSSCDELAVGQGVVGLFEQKS